MPLIAWLLVVMLMLLHQDWWLWENDTILLGLVPVGLALHMGISVAAAMLWAHICYWHWPRELDEVESMTEEQRNDRSGTETGR